MSEMSFEERFWITFDENQKLQKGKWDAENALREIQAMLEPLLTLSKNQNKDLAKYRELYVDHIERALHQVNKVIKD